MLFAAWRQRGTDTALPSPPGGGSEQLQLPDGAFTVRRPARLERRENEALGWLYSGVPSALAHDARGPEVRLGPEGISFSCGPLPQHPLYFYRAPGDSLVVVSTELEPLLRCVPRGDLNLRRLVAVSSWQLDDDPGATAFRHIRRVRAGELVTVDARGWRSSIRIPSVRAHFRREPPSALAAELRDRLDASVGRAIGDARKVAVFVGGGLDSSGLVALAAARCRGANERELQAIAAIWASPGDDRPHLDALERELGITAIRVSAARGGAWFLKSLCADAQPQVFYPACQEMLLWSEGAASGADVALGGYGGDFICGGDVSFGRQFLQGHPLAAINNARRLEVPWDATWRDRVLWVAGPLVRPLLRDSWVDERRRRRVHMPWMTPRYREILDPLLHASPAAPQCPRDRMEQFCGHATLSELTVSWGQVTSVVRAAPVDVFRDIEFVRFMAEIDPITASHDHRYRGLYRLAMKGLIPERIRVRPDKALGEPFAAEAAVAAGVLDELRDLGSLDRMAALGLADPDGFARPFADWLRAVARGERTAPDHTDGGPWIRIWPMLATEAFLRWHDAYRAQGAGRSPWAQDGVGEDSAVV